MMTPVFPIHNPHPGIPAPASGGLPPICLITHEFHPKHGGIATFAEEIARAASALGHRIEVWAQAAAAGAEKAWPFPVRRLPLKGTHGLTCRARLALELINHRRQLRNATVYMPEPGPLLTMMPLQFISGFRPKRLILTFHGSEVLRFHRNPMNRVLLRQLISNATRISTLTNYTHDLLCNCFPEAIGKTIITPGALRTDLFADGAGATGATSTANAANTANGTNAANTANATNAANGMRTPYEAAPGKLVVLTVGRVHPRKGQLHTLRALQALPPALRGNVEYWIAGKLTGSEYEKTLRAAIAENGIALALGGGPDGFVHPEPGPAFPSGTVPPFRITAAAGAGRLTVRLLGEVPDHALGAVYARADVFAMTSVNYRNSIEGFGLVYLEAAAHGLPVVAHDVGGVSEAVLHGETGLVVTPPGRHENTNPQLTGAFEKLLGDVALRKRLGAAGRAHAHRNNWLESARKLFATAQQSPGAPK